MKKIFRNLLVIMFGVFLISSINVKATPPLVEAIDGASIRTQGVQGLRFYAKLGETTTSTEHGFYLIYGEATVQQLTDAITVAAGGQIILNDKVVFKVVVPGVTVENEFSVVLTGIPETGYFDEISVIAYVDDGLTKTYVDAPVTRSVATVALKIANNQSDTTNIDNLLTVIKGTLKKKVAINAFGNLEVSSSLYEHNHFNLREEFLKDWNTKFNLNLLDLAGLNFYNSAIVGITDPNNLTGSNLYEFFNDLNYGDKWGWLLNFLNESDPLNESPASTQIAAVMGDGTSGAELLESGIHLSYSLTNFFNQEDLYSNSITFNNESDYNNLNNNKVYVDLANYNLYDVGESITVPEAPERLGYEFLYYMTGLTQVLPGQYTLTIDDVVFKPIYVIKETAIAQVVIAGNPSNMLENTNYAAHADLNPEIFTVNSIKGAAGQGVGLYEGAFRIYSVRASGDGNTLKISIAESYEITKIKINYASSGAATTAHLDLGGTVQNISALKGGSQDYTDLAVSYFSIKNTHEGGSENLQIHIESIEITYQGKGGPAEPTNQEKVNLDLAELNLPEQVIEPGTLNLPVKGTRGSTITWASSNEAIIAINGTVVLPTEETEVTLTATITLGEVTDTKEFLVTVFPLGSEPQILNQSDFGKTDGWGSYGERTNQAIEHGEEDPNPSGNSSWDLKGGNVNNADWDYIRMGGKAASTKEGLQVYLKTNFTFEVEIKEIIIDVIALDSAKENETIWLQTSTDGKSWTDVTSKEITAAGDLVFDNLTIASGNYFRFVIVRDTTSSNRGTDIKTITFKG